MPCGSQREASPSRDAQAISLKVNVIVLSARGASYVITEACVKQMKQKVKEQFHLFLSQKGLKGTLQRNLILDAFLNLDRPTHFNKLYLH